MTNERKQQIIDDLFTIYNNDLPEMYGTEWSMFALMSMYNRAGKNAEKIDGNWVLDNAPSPLRELT